MVRNYCPPIDMVARKETQETPTFTKKKRGRVLEAPVYLERAIFIKICKKTTLSLLSYITILQYKILRKQVSHRSNKYCDLFILSLNYLAELQANIMVV